MVRAAAAATITFLLAILCGPAAADPAATPAADGAREAEKLVREVYYEGLPPERARDLDDAGVARLAALLDEPAESAHHANALLALGMSGHPDAFGVLASYARRPIAGEVDRDTFRAHTRLYRAMGHLAREDPRALAWLLSRSQRPSAAPDWHFRHQAGARLATLLDEQILGALALSGSDEAEARLRRAEAEARGATPADQRRRRLVEHAREQRRIVAEEGPEALRGATGR